MKNCKEHVVKDWTKNVKKDVNIFGGSLYDTWQYWGVIERAH